MFPHKLPRHTAQLTFFSDFGRGLWRSLWHTASSACGEADAADITGRLTFLFGAKPSRCEVTHIL